MPYKFDNLPINDPKHDKRVKLTEDDKEKIRQEYATGLISQRGLARKYKVSKRTIQFVLDPEKLERVKEQFKERRKDGRYYSKEKQREYMKKHRDHKKELWAEGKIKEHKEGRDND